MRSIMMILGLLFIALSHPSFAQKAGAEAEAEAEVVVRVAEGAPLTVECPLRVEQAAQWRRDGGALPAGLRPAGEAAPGGGAVAARLHAAAARAQHAGTYTCARGPGARRVRVLVLPAAPPAPAPAPGTEPAAAAPAPAEQPPHWVVYMYDLHRAIELNCKPDGDAEAPPGTYAWKANGTDVEQVSGLTGRYALKEGGAVLAVARSLEEDWGNYTCSLQGAPARGFEVRARHVLRLAPDSNVVEGQKLKLTCRVMGQPYPAVTWTYAADALGNVSEVGSLLGARVKLQTSAAGVRNGELVIEAAERADAGLYSCLAPALGDAPAPNATTVLRVKDMYAALWPFLGICAEVFILCAIILVYEKRRTKPELDDSDTDNHEQ